MKQRAERLIGDFLEANTDIVVRQHNSKLPKFISKLESKYYRKKLIKIIKKFKNSDVILTKDNLVEFFAYTFNNFPPKGKFNSINSSIVIDGNTEGILFFDDIKVVITIEKEQEKFELIIDQTTKTNENNKYVFQLSELYSDNPITKDLVAKLNKQIVLEISTYLLDTISAYK